MGQQRLLDPGFGEQAGGPDGLELREARAERLAGGVELAHPAPCPGEVDQREAGDRPVPVEGVDAGQQVVDGLRRTPLQQQHLADVVLDDGDGRRAPQPRGRVTALPVVPQRAVEVAEQLLRGPDVVVRHHQAHEVPELLVDGQRLSPVSDRGFQLPELGQRPRERLEGLRALTRRRPA